MNSDQSGDRSPWVIEIEHLSRHFRDKEALHDVSLQVAEGSIFGLVGINGAGKTTLIRHILGSYRAQQGRVTVLGCDPAAAPEVVLKKLGYLSEEDSLPRWMRVGDLIDFSSAVYPTWDFEYAKRMCDDFGLMRSSKLSSLSKGQRSRAGLLVAIAHRPQLLVLDEPSSGLDPIARGDILEAVIRTISEEGRTVLFSSHLLDEVDRICDSIAMMHQGRMLESLTLEQIQTKYCEVLGFGSCPWENTLGLLDRTNSVFGLHRQGSEWSIVCPREIVASLFQSEPLPAVEVRDLTLQRWFVARVSAAASSSQFAASASHAAASSLQSLHSSNHPSEASKL